jgi:PPOX class probable F420-dependent enzyme
MNDKRVITMLTQSHPFASLAKASYINLTTYRKTGEAVATPIWFAENNGTIYVETGPRSGKVKRIHHTTRVTLEPCTIQGRVTGASVEGNARILNHAEEDTTARAALAKKYGLMRSIYYGFMNIFRIVRHKPEIKLTYIAIEPLD